MENSAGKSVDDTFCVANSLRRVERGSDAFEFEDTMAEGKGKTHSVSIDGELTEVKQIELNQLTQDLQKCFEQFTQTVLPAVRLMGEAFFQLSVEMGKVSVSLYAAFEASQEGEWWKNGGQPPLYKHSPNTPEWWQRGDDPPMFDSAA
jgi:hypothetical protein